MRILLIICCIAILSTAISAQEVFVGGFPIGVGNSIDPDFFKPYHEELKKIADSLAKYSKAQAIITGGADGEHYKSQHDIKNPGLALGRAHALRSVLVKEFNVNPSQIIVSSEDVRTKGDNYRYASVRIIWTEVTLERQDVNIDDLQARIKDLEDRPPVEKHFTEVKETPAPIPNPNHYGIIIKGGLSTSPFGEIPIVGSGVTWKRILFFEFMAGHTVWNNNYTFDNEKLDTKKRLFGGHLTYYPFEDYEIGFIGGWVKVEEIAQQYYDYVRMSEGPMFGVKYTVSEFVSVSAIYNPSKHRIAGDRNASSKNGQFLFQVNIFKIFGASQ